MDKQTSEILKRINLHQRIRKILIFSSYFLILSGVLSFIFFSINKHNKKYKLIAEAKKNKIKFESEKIMINPRIKIKYNQNQTYDVEAKKASHINNKEVKLFDVFAYSEIGNIKSGQLEIYQNGDHLIFSDNPVLILNQDKIE